MVKIICKEDCGNAPKKLLLKELTSAFAKGTAQRELLPQLAADATWEIVGAAPISGSYGSGGLALETAGGAQRMLFINGGGTVKP